MNKFERVSSDHHHMSLQVGVRLIRTRLIRNSTLFKVLVKFLRNVFLSFQCLKCTVNSNFHLIRSKNWLMNDFELTVAQPVVEAVP